MESLSLKSPKKASGIHGLTLGLGQMGLRSTWNLSHIVNKVKGVYFVACCRKTGSSNPHPIYTSVSAFRGDLNTKETDKRASQTLLKRRAVNSPIVRSAKKRRVSSVPRTN